MRKHDSRGGLLDAAGSLTLKFGPVPRGTEWHFERISYNTNSAANPDVEVYVNEDYLTDRGTGVTVNISDEQNPVYVGEGMMLAIVVTGGTAGAVFDCDVQINMEEAEPALSKARGPKAAPISGLRPQWW